MRFSRYHLENRDFRLKGVKSVKFLVNSEDSLDKEENSLFSSNFYLFPTIKSKNAFFSRSLNFFKIFLISKNRDFRFKGDQSEKFEVNNEDSLFNEETSLFS